LPARGGDVAKLTYLRKNGKPSWEILASATLLERGFDFLALGLIGLTASLALGLHDATIISGILLFITTSGLLLLPRIASLSITRKKAGNFSSTVKKTGQRKLLLVCCFCICCLCWTANSTIMGLLLMAFDETISLTHTFAVTPPSILAGIAPVSLWGIGTRDGALAYFLQGLTAPENAISASFLYTALIYWFLGLIGSPALFFAKKTTKPFTDAST